MFLSDCGFNAHRKCSEKVPNDCCPDLKHIHRIFGIDLTTVVKACNTVRPFILDICINEIENRGIYVEGLYRESGLSDDVEALKVALERDWDKASLTLKAFDDIHVITGVLKLYLRSLPIPLITFDAYPHFLTALSMFFLIVMYEFVKLIVSIILQKSRLWKRGYQVSKRPFLPVYLLHITSHYNFFYLTWRKCQKIRTEI